MHGSHRTRGARTDEPVSAAEAAEFIVHNLALAPAPALPEIRLGRAYLPHGQLRLIAQYPVPDFADPGAATRKPGLVCSFEGQAGEKRTDQPFLRHAD